MNECEPWLKYQERQLLFREAVIHFLVGETEEEKRKRQEREFCRACKAAKKNRDCDACDRRITVRLYDEDDEQQRREEAKTDNHAQRNAIYRRQTGLRGRRR